MTPTIQASRAAALLLLLLLPAADRGAAPGAKTQLERAQVGDSYLRVSAEDGRLVFQREDAGGSPLAEPWFWPEELGSLVTYETPRLVQNDSGTWLIFLERGTDGSTRSRAISLSEIFADGFESATTAAWSSTEPAVNLFLEAPAPNAAIGDATPTLRALFATPTGIAIAPESLVFLHDGAPLAVGCTPVQDGADCVPKVPFADGPIFLTATISDIAGHVSPPAARQFTVDTAAPSVLLTSPAEGFLTGDSSILVAGSVSEPVTLTVGGTPIALAPDLTFSVSIPLSEGPNVLVVTATDAAGNTSLVSRNGTSDTTPPLPISAALVSTGSTSGNASITGAAGAAEANARVRWRNQRTGQVVEILAGADGSFATALGVAEGDILIAVAIDALDRQSLPAYFPIDYQVPPDPTLFAPPLDPTVAYDLGDAIRFLYDGDNAIQRGVTPGAIEERRIAWLRGTVRQRGGDPLPGVRVKVPEHPELGYTLTRADGVFDLVVNGGGLVTLEFERAGFLPAQRQETMGWRDSTVIEDVVLLGLDPVATAITSGSASGQLARSTPRRDVDGIREARLFFPPGTTASLELADGSTQPLPVLTFRATEYTVGDDGLKAMPGPLPENVAYTYAVELSADEAIAARAKHVNFSQAVYFYLDNFIPFPVGSAVPVAWYDRERAAWIPSNDGRVIEILAAGIDVDGSGSPADAETLAQLGFTDAERLALAGQYPPGHKIWRVPIEHFSPYDMNYPFSPPDDAEEPPEPVTKTNDPDPDETDPEADQHDDDGNDEDESPTEPVVAGEDPDCVPGSIIECENQIVRQQIAITGTPYQLAYSSQRTPGWGADQVANFEVRGASVPASLKEIELLVHGNGIAEGTRLSREEFANAPFLASSVRLPETDAFGRPVHGQRRFRVRLSYLYPRVYRASIPELERSWARFPAVTAARVDGVPSQRFSTVFSKESVTSYDQLFRSSFGTWDGRSQKLGGFTLNVHHAYDPAARTLHLGNGSRKSARALAPTLQRIAGTGLSDYSGDGGPATFADLNFPNSLAWAADGSLYIIDALNYRIRAVRPDGIIETVAGTGERCTYFDDGSDDPPPQTCDENIPAVDAGLNRPAGLAVGADGSLYFADAEQGCIRKVDPQDILRTVAGICRPFDEGPQGIASGPSSPSTLGESGPATNIELNEPSAIAVRSDGTLFIVDAGGLSQITTDGTLLRVLQLEGGIRDLVAGASGELYLLDASFGRIYELRVDGQLELIAGGGELFGSDGVPATSAYLMQPGKLAFGRDSRLYFIEAASRVRRIESGGTLKTVAGPKPVEGEYQIGPPEAGNFLLDNRFFVAADVAIAIDGSTFIADASSNQVFKGDIAYPDYISDELLIAEGGEVYVFNQRGRHLRTRHAVTGALLYSFEYDPQGLLTGITDGNGNTTSIVRDGNGNATSIVSPFGQVTSLTLDASGWLESIENPNQEAHHFTYRFGLMLEKSDPRGFVKKYEYSPLGRLTATVDEELKRRELSLISRRGWPDNTISLEGPNHENHLYTTRTGPSGEVYRSQQDADGLFMMSTSYRDGSTFSQSRGVTSYAKRRPDPRLGESGGYAARSRVAMSLDLVSESSSSVDAPLTDPADPWSFETISSISETNGRLTSPVYTAASRDLTTVSPAGRVVSLQLDELAKPIGFAAPDTEPWSASYLESGELEEIVIGSGAAERRTVFGYDAFHRLASIVDAEDRQVSFGFDAANRVTSTLLPDGKAVGFGYDSSGNVTSVTPPGRPAHVFTYTPRNQLQTYTLPDVGTGPAVEERIYDASKRLQEVRRPDGKVITFDYQPNGNRLDKIISPRGETRFAYNETNGLVSEIEEPDGQLLSFEYEGTLLKRTTWSGEVNGSVGRTYDNNFRVTSIDVNGQDPIQYVYDDDNLLVQVGEMTITRDPESGREVSTQLGNVTTERTYTPFGEPETYTAKFGETEIYFEHLTYNKLGWITDLERRQNGYHENLHYGYDERGRLEEVWRDGVLESSYTYDDNSNRLSYTGPLGNATGTYDNRDRVLTYGAASYTWSDAGELLTKTEGGENTTFDYDVFGNLRGVVLPNGIEVEYLIDGAQRRIGKKVNGVLTRKWLYQSKLKPIAESSGAGDFEARFVYADRGNVPSFVLKNGSVYRLICDILGSPRLIVESIGGALQQELRYDAYGRLLLDTSPEFQPFGFSGGLVDSQLNLLRYGARDYSSSLGRWTVSDPIGFASKATNLYEYARSRPVDLIDPSGLAAVNNCKCTIYVKPDTGPFANQAIPVAPGATYPDRVDGVAVPWRPDEAFKATDYQDVSVDADGSVEADTNSGSAVSDLFYGAVQLMMGGWKGPDFLQDLQSQGDNGWNDLFNSTKAINSGFSSPALAAKACLQ